MKHVTAAERVAATTRTPSAGRIVAAAFSLWGLHLPRFTLLALVTSLPAIAYTWLVEAEGVVAGLLDFVCSGLTAAAVVHGVFQLLAGRRASVSECLGTALRHLLSVLAASLLIAVCVGLVPGGLAYLLGRAMGPAGLVFGGLLAATLYAAVAVTIPALVTEGCTVSEAIERSAELTRGARLKVLGALLVALIVPAVVELVVPRLFVDVALAPAVARGVELGFIVVRAAGTALVGITGAVTYHELRTAREGMSREALAEVFE